MLFLSECRKIETKFITLANQKGHRQYGDPIKTFSRKAREKKRKRVMIGFGFISDWMKKWHEVFKPIG